MANLYEYQGKELLKMVGVLVPEGGIAATPREAHSLAKKIAKPVAIKAQIWATGRFAAGGVKFAETPEEAEHQTQEMMKVGIKGLKVEYVLIEEKISVEREFYCGVIINDSYKVKGPILIFSSRGGTGIEEIAAKYPEEVKKVNVDILKGVDIEDIKKMVEGLPIAGKFIGSLSQVICGIYQAFEKYDLRSIEANPIVVTRDGDLYAADCHAAIDDSSVFKHPELGIEYPRDIGRYPTELEKVAWSIEKEDFRGTGYFVQMIKEIKPGEGYVGFHGIGGGGAMLGADALIRNGIKIANFADTSGNPTTSKVYRIIKLIFSQPNIEGYVLMGAVVANQDQWHHANALVKALKEELANRLNFPVVLLIAGNKERESIEILKEGLKDVPARVEIYGREYVYNVDYVAERVKTLIEEYRNFKKRGGV